MSDVSGSFDYTAVLGAKSESFQNAFQSFLKENGFISSLPPKILFSDSGGHGTGATDIWLKGSYHGSEQFFLRYYIDVSSNVFSIHAFTIWDIYGTDSDKLKMQEATRQFSKTLRDLALQYR